MGKLGVSVRVSHLHSPCFVTPGAVLALAGGAEPGQSLPGHWEMQCAGLEGSAAPRGVPGHGGQQQLLRVGLEVEPEPL